MLVTDAQLVDLVNC